METLDRRAFLRGSTAVGGLVGTGVPALTAAAQTVQSPTLPLEQNITARLAAYAVKAKFADLPSSVRTEAARSLLNWIGVAVGGSRHETIAIVLAALKPFFGPPKASLLGRAERVDGLHAALINGISSHVFDYDDTDLATIIHPSAPILPAMFALAEDRTVSGPDFMNAFVLGVEAACRIGRAVNPAHYALGWHITGTAGVFGAAVACGKLLGLDEQRMRWAISLAATQPVGLREMFGTMTKSFHPGRAAQNGLTAALLAAQGFTSSDAALEAKRGWMPVISTEQHYDIIVDGLGQRYEITRNSYKPFACGVVIHPIIDGCIQLRNKHRLKASDIEGIDLAVNPQVIELTGKRTPQTGLDGKFSVYHAAAVAIIAGMAGEKQFSDEIVRDRAVVALRDRVQTTVEPGLHEDQAKLVIRLKGGRRVEQFIVHALGSAENPMSDKQLDAKFIDLANGILPADKTRRLMNLCRESEKLPDIAAIAREASLAVL